MALPEPTINQLLREFSWDLSRHKYKAGDNHWPDVFKFETSKINREDPNRYWRPLKLPDLQPTGKPPMNPSAAVMLVEDSIRPCMVEYDPDNYKNNSDNRYFKCLDASIKVDDLVIVTTNTRHGMTVARVKKIGVADVPVNFEGQDFWGWIVGPVPSDQHKRILDTEKAIVGRVQEATTNKLKTELKAAMGLAAVSFSDLDLTKAAELPAPPPEAAPVQPPASEATEA